MAVTRRSGAVTESASAQTLTATMPAGVANGDVLIMCYTGDGIVANFTAPGAGWTQILAPAAISGNLQVMASYRHVVTDAAAIPTCAFSTTSAAGRQTMIVEAYTGVDNTTPIDVVGATADINNTANAVVAPSITTGKDGNMLVSHVGTSYSADLITVSGGSMVRENVHTSNVGRCNAVGDEVQALAGASGTRTWTRTTATLTALKAYIISLNTAAGSVTWRAAGKVTTTAVQVSAKLAGVTSARVRVATDSGLTSIVASSSAAAPDANGYIKHDVTGLTADTQYYFGIELDGVIYTSMNGQFKTAPSGAKTFKVGFGSCQNNAASAGLDNLFARSPDLFIHLGDLGYWDNSTNDQAAFRTLYDATMVRTGLKNAFGKTSSVYLWSDHDFGGNNSDASVAANPAVNAVYRQVFPHHTLGSATSTGIYQTFAWGRVRFVCCDTRSFRSANSATDNASKTMLGATQLQWVKDTINAATEKLIVLSFDVPWVGAAVAGEDDWTGFTTERTNLATFLDGCGKPTIIIAGDMHGDAYDDGTNAAAGNTGSSGDGVLMVCHGAPFYQTASQKGGPYSGGIYPPSGAATVQQYGFLTFTDAGGSTMTVDYVGYDSSNVAQITGSKTITLPADAAAAAAGGPHHSNVISFMSIQD